MVRSGIWNSKIGWIERDSVNLKWKKSNIILRNCFYEKQKYPVYLI